MAPRERLCKRYATVTTMFHRIREDIACVFERDPAARTTLEVLTTSPVCTRSCYIG